MIMFCYFIKELKINKKMEKYQMKFRILFTISNVDIFYFANIMEILFLEFFKRFMRKIYNH